MSGIDFGLFSSAATVRVRDCNSRTDGNTALALGPLAWESKALSVDGLLFF